MADAAVPAPETLLRRSAWGLAIGALVLAFVVHAGLIARTKSSTYDEPVHAFSSWLIVNRGDFRANAEHPALWKYVAGLALVRWDLPVNLNAPLARKAMSVVEDQWWWVRSVLYLDAPNPATGEALVARARVPMLLFAAALACVVARWAWVWGGPVAALIATALLALDPNLLAHAGLVTNDVGATLFITFAVYLTWRLGTRFSWLTATSLILTTAAAISIKFTCLLLAPILGMLLIFRLMDRSPWPIFQRANVPHRGARAVLVGGLAVVSVATAWASLWPVYQFRDAPARDGSRFDDTYPRTLLAYYKLMADDDLRPPAARKSKAQLLAEAATYHHGLLSSFFFALSEKHLVPQAWGFGLNYANARSILRDTYLLGEVSNRGSWKYFPLAVLFKTPTATLALALGCAVFGTRLAFKRVRSSSACWKLVCLLVPPIVYFAFACASNLNIGIRHILPIYPPMFVAIGVLLARAIQRKPGVRWVAAIAVILIGAETLSATPNTINFFNLIAGGQRGGFDKLGDSNLDWGQDLKALAEWYHPWRKANPNAPFYLSYFGTVPPTAYGIEYINAPPGTDFDRTPKTNDIRAGVYVISASHLQAISKPFWTDAMAKLRKLEPDEIINGTLYVYRVGPGTRLPEIKLEPSNTIR